MNDQMIIDCLGYAMRQKEASERAGDETMPVLYMRPVFYRFLQTRLYMSHLVHFGGLYIIITDDVNRDECHYTCYLQEV